MSVVALLVHPERPQAAELAAAAARRMVEEDHEVRLPPKDAELAGLGDLACEEPKLAAGLDLAVSLGGDGTMLRTVHLVAAGGAAVLGVNVGQLGYLTEVEPGELDAALDRFFTGDHRVEERMLVDVRVEGEAPQQATGLNEAVLEKTPMGHTVRLAASISGTPFTTYAADGLIVATPTGSTAYSFSARGPIVDPAHHALVLTPVSPHMLFDRSLVLAPDASVRLEVIGGRPATLSVDGRNLGILDVGEALVCTASDLRARLVRFGPSDFHRILKHKFGLSDR